MKMFFVAAGLASVLLVTEMTQGQESQAPFMASLTDLKWVELPERKGMQFAILSVDLKTGPTRRCAKSRPGPTTRCIRIAAS